MASGASTTNPSSTSTLSTNPLPSTSTTCLPPSSQPTRLLEEKEVYSGRTLAKQKEKTLPCVISVEKGFPLLGIQLT